MDVVAAGTASTDGEPIVQSMMKRTLDTTQPETSNQLVAYLMTTGKQVLKTWIDLG